MVPSPGLVSKEKKRKKERSGGREGKSRETVCVCMLLSIKLEFCPLGDVVLCITAM